MKIDRLVLVTTDIFAILTCP